MAKGEREKRATTILVWRPRWALPSGRPSPDVCIRTMVADLHDFREYSTVPETRARVVPRKEKTRDAEYEQGSERVVGVCSQSPQIKKSRFGTGYITADNNVKTAG